MNRDCAENPLEDRMNHFRHPGKVWLSERDCVVPASALTSVFALPLSSTVRITDRRADDLVGVMKLSPTSDRRRLKGDSVRGIWTLGSCRWSFTPRKEDWLLRFELLLL